MSETRSARERLFDALAAGVCGHALGPYLDEVEFAAIRLATPPTPLPADVQAAVSRCLKWEHHLRSGFNPALVRESRESLAADLRTLLAHLTREAR